MTLKLRDSEELCPTSEYKAPAATRRFALTFEFIRFRFDYTLLKANP